jgi:hypothetical protein
LVAVLTEEEGVSIEESEKEEEARRWMDKIKEDEG